MIIEEKTTKTISCSSQTILDCGHADYLNQVINELPKNCLFNKVITGAGGTTIALTDNAPTVICVPYVSLIKNKLEQANNTGNKLYQYPVFGFYGGITQQQLNSYLRINGTPKIMVTYDSLGKLASMINPEEYNILIDEYHCLFMNYSFRELAAEIVLNNFRKFKSFTFMTATPVEDEFLLKELIGIPVITAKWEHTREVKLRLIRGGRSVTKTCINTVNRFLNGADGNAYFFVNSVKFINEIIKNCRLSSNNTRVIYSEHNEINLYNGLVRGSTTDAPRKINFITSTAFEGCDIYDENGKTIIVSDATREHTLLDIQIQIPQILGRIRNSKHNTIAYHIYSNPAQYDSTMLSYQAFKKIADVRMAQAKLLISRFGGDDQTFNRLLLEAVERNGSTIEGIEYLKIGKDEAPILDTNRQLIQLYKYRITNCVYVTRKNLKSAYEAKNLTIDKWHEDFSDFDVVPAGNITSFKQAVKHVQSMETHLNAGTSSSYEDELLLLECHEKYPDLKEALERLGLDYIIQIARYDQSNIKRKLITSKSYNSLDDTRIKIFKLLVLTRLFNLGSFVSSADAKNALKEAYSEVGSELTAKAIDIQNFFKIMPTSKRINGKKTTGFHITGHNINPNT
jgi:hypothetical protein